MKSLPTLNVEQLPKIRTEPIRARASSEQPRVLRVWRTVPSLCTGNEEEEGFKLREVLALALGTVRADAEPHLCVSNW